MSASPRLAVALSELRRAAEALDESVKLSQEQQDFNQAALDLLDALLPSGPSLIIDEGLCRYWVTSPTGETFGGTDTYRRYDLLYYLAKNHGTWCARDDVERAVYGRTALRSNVMHVLVYRARQDMKPAKLGFNPIETNRGTLRLNPRMNVFFVPNGGA